MKRLSKVLALLLIGCGVACGLTAGAAVKVDYSSKEAVTASIFNAILLNDSEAFLQCFSPRVRAQFPKECAEQGMTEKEFVNAQMKDVRDGLMANFNFVQKNGKWYIELFPTTPAPSPNRADRAAQLAVVARFFNSVLMDDPDGFWACLSENSKAQYRLVAQAQGMDEKMLLSVLLPTMRRSLDKGDLQYVQQDGKWYIDNSDVE